MGPVKASRKSLVEIVEQLDCRTVRLELDINSTPNAPNYSSVQQTPADETPQVPESAVLVVCHSSEERHISPDILTVSSQTPVPQLLGDLIEKGIARKFYLSIIIERHIRVEALLDTGADITLISTELLEEVQERTKRTNRTLKLQRCELNLQAYSHIGLQLKHVAPIHLKVGSMDLVHPVYVSPRIHFSLGKICLIASNL